MRNLIFVNWQLYKSLILQIVTVVKSDWQMAITLWKVVLKCAMMECGGRCAVISGTEMMQL